MDPASGSRLWLNGIAQTAAFLHVDEVAVLGEPIDQSRGQMIIFEKGTPFAKAQIGGQESGLLFVPFLPSR